MHIAHCFPCPQAALLHLFGLLASLGDDGATFEVVVQHRLQHSCNTRVILDDQDDVALFQGGTLTHGHTSRYFSLLCRDLLHQQNHCCSHLDASRLTAGQAQTPNVAWALQELLHVTSAKVDLITL